MSVTKMSPSMMTASGKRTTPFGAVENLGLLLNLPDKVILRVDTLACLKEMWGENILMARQHLYELVAGTVSDSDFQELITSYYKRYAAFANYVDEKYLFGEQQLPLVFRIIGPARDCIKQYEERLIAQCQMRRGRYIGSHQDFAYFAFNTAGHLPEFEESCRVC